MITNPRKRFLKQERKRLSKIIETIPVRFEIIAEGKKMIREGIRQDYDRLKETIDAANTNNNVFLYCLTRNSTVGFRFLLF